MRKLLKRRSGAARKMCIERKAKRLGKEFTKSRFYQPLSLLLDGCFGSMKAASTQEEKEMARLGEKGEKSNLNGQ